MHREKDGVTKRLLIVTSVNAEKEAVIRGIGRCDWIDVVVVGVGSSIAAARTAIALCEKKYDLVINMGIAGGFKERAPICSVVVASEIVAADLGAESEGAFLPIDELQLGTSRIRVDLSTVQRIIDGLMKHSLQTAVGPIITLSTVTGTAARADELASRIDGVVAEGMEGYGVAVAAAQFETPVMEIRTISNMVGPRDRESWRIKEALSILEDVSYVMTEVLS